MKPCSLCGRPAHPICDTYADGGMCWDCRGQLADRCAGDTGIERVWIARSWIGLDGKRHGGYQDPRKRQGRLFE